jgi:hypothetical protein
VQECVQECVHPYVVDLHQKTAMCALCAGIFPKFTRYEIAFKEIDVFFLRKSLKRLHTLHTIDFKGKIAAHIAAHIFLFTAHN